MTFIESVKNKQKFHLIQNFARSTTVSLEFSKKFVTFFQLSTDASSDAEEKLMKFRKEFKFFPFFLAFIRELVLCNFHLKRWEIIVLINFSKHIFR